MMNQLVIYLYFNNMKDTVLCILFGCDWMVNSPSLPNKAICTQCKKKMELDLHSLKWEFVESFKNEKRSDKTLIKKWTR